MRGVGGWKKVEVLKWVRCVRWFHLKREIGLLGSVTWWFALPAPTSIVITLDYSSLHHSSAWDSLLSQFFC